VNSASFTVDSYLRFYSTSQWLRGNWSCDKNLQPDWCAASRMQLQTSVNAFTRPFPPHAEVGWPARLEYTHTVGLVVWVEPHGIAVPVSTLILW